MSEKTLSIFTRAYSEKLLEDLENESSVLGYLEIDFTPEQIGLLESSVTIPEQAPGLDQSVESDVDNAIKVFEYLQNIDMTQASDKRLWIYLSHVTFREYTIGRWSLKQTAEELKSNRDALNKASNYIAEHWFLSGNARSLRRHSIARLWWAANLTVAPWEKEPEYYLDLDETDRFVYTRVLFSTQDIAQGIMERKLGWSDKIAFAILEYLRQNPTKRESARSLIKELNLMLGYRKLTMLSFQELVSTITDIANTE